MSAKRSKYFKNNTKVEKVSVGFLEDINKVENSDCEHVENIQIIGTKKRKLSQQLTKISPELESCSNIVTNDSRSSPQNIAKISNKSDKIDKFQSQPTSDSSVNFFNVMPSIDINFTQVDRLKDDFFDKPCIDLAKSLLGKILVRAIWGYNENGTQQIVKLIKGKIVETESYLGGEDKASCSYQNKMTPRNKPMFMKPGTAFVYFTYGMYHCFNISSRGDGAAVLLRAIEPIYGIETISEHRMIFLQNRSNKKEKNSKTNSAGTKDMENNKGNSKSQKKNKEIGLNQLCNGPAKLCIGFDIDVKQINKLDLCACDKLWVENPPPGDNENNKEIVISSRIGIDSVGPPWSKSLLRFYVYGSPCVSKRDKKSEELLRNNMNV